MTERGAPSLEPVFRAERRLVWGLAYRMTGSAADADDIVQETFARALAHAPETDRARELRPWLTKVAMNLGRDALRRRRRQAYTGPWLPSPVDDERLGPWAPDGATLFERREGAAYAFLRALEVLTPQQRGVLVLRDVFDRSVAETAAALGLDEVRVRVTHHRARARLKAARESSPSGAEATSDHAASLTRFVTALATGDDAGLLACLTEGVRVVSDGGGEFIAALRPVEGRERVLRFFTGLRSKLGQDGAVEIRSVNGKSCLVAEQRTAVARAAPRWLLHIEVTDDGHIDGLYLVVASRKLTHVRELNSFALSRRHSSGEASSEDRAE